ncbi:unnamed protein product, partial [Owenia fusiformis]
SCHLLCRDDADCESLGSTLLCIKGACGHGVCGCQRGFAARFAGSEPDRLMKCVELKKIGESCSTDLLGAQGVCGSIGSKCDHTEQKCMCSTGVPIFGGEACSSETNPITLPSSTAGDGPGTCTGSSAENDYDTFGGGYTYGSYAMDGLYSTCACPQGQKSEITNAFGSQFLGKKTINCVQIKHGDLCLNDDDCRLNSGSQMTCSASGVCECETSAHVPNYEKTQCRPGLSFNANCDVGGSHCNGDEGLMCMYGTDYCDTDPDTTVTRKCLCGPQHTTSGSTCNPIGDGGSCQGDLNCKGFSKNGICVDNTCQNS